MKKRKGIGLVEKKGMWGYLFISPFIVGLIFIFIPTVAKSLFYSFNDVKIEFSNITTKFLGFKNYYDAFMTDPKFRVVLIAASKGILVDSTIIIFFSFFIANLLNQKFIGRGFVRTIFFLPVVLSVGIVAAMEKENLAYNAMSLVSDSTNGFDQLGMQAMFSTFNIMAKLGLPNSISTFTMTAINNTYNIVNSSGVQILLFLSSLQSISPSIFEAAKVEGATKWEEFWKITFPMLSPMILVNVVYTVIDTFTNPTYGIMDFIETQAFNSGKLGYAAALSWIYFLIVIVVLAITAGIISRRVNYLE
jgi:ABC-type sugar transport system permease subunit